MLINVENLKKGMILNDDVKKHDSDILPLIFKQSVVDDRVLRMLNQYNIKNVDVYVNKNVNETIDDNLRISLINSYKNLDFLNMISICRKMISIFTIKKSFNFDASRYTLESDDMYTHSVNVCMYSIMLGILYNETLSANKINLEDLAVSSLLHEVGTLLKDNPNLSKYELNDGALDKNKFPGYDKKAFSKYNPNMYPLYGYSMLKDESFISNTSRVAILFQTENDSLDPNVQGILKADSAFIKNQISSKSNSPYALSKIINLANIYDLLCRKVIKGKIKPEIIQAAIIEMVKEGKIDRNLSYILLENIPLYSPGTKVKLSNGDAARVLGYNKVETENGFFVLSPALKIQEVSEYGSDNFINPSLDEKISSKKM